MSRTPKPAGTPAPDTASWTVGQWEQHIEAGGCEECQPNGNLRPVCTRPARTYL